MAEVRHDPAGVRSHGAAAAATCRTCPARFSPVRRRSRPRPVETITYKINPEAVWSDKVAITCDDFVYTVDQQTERHRHLRPHRLRRHRHRRRARTRRRLWSRTSSGKTFATWQSLFAGSVGIMPSHILKGKDRDAAMKDGYTWSGGPWIAKWTKGDNITLTPNANYWGTKPKLDKVDVQVPRRHVGRVPGVQVGSGLDDLPAAADRRRRRDRSAVSPTPTPSTTRRPRTVEALWINNQKAPFDTKDVRQAFAYAIDRNAIVKQLFGKLGVTTAVELAQPVRRRRRTATRTPWANYKLDTSTRSTRS